MPLLRKQEAGQVLLSVLSPQQLKVKDWPALILSNPDSSDALQGGEGIGQTLELVTNQIENGEPGQTRELSGNFHDLVVTEGE